ncbi:M1 family metallopeptidase [Maribacter ulvicola]|uniref:Peptidase family M1 n=1 Tax=Maribacter ulvicola TaxID=228959 RepID=A0A1N6Q0R0_9FLAO|nr:M1 family metallopeptidase [Maribacter ulvicola]SIQ10168.1 Peptidase family M1 [Maribacter ulvicola]
MKRFLGCLLFAAISIQLHAQEKKFTHADTLRGTITPERAWWDVLKYDISVTPNFEKKYTSGCNIITYKVVQEKHPEVMQIDLQEPLKIDSIVYDKTKSLTFKREGNVFYVQTPKQKINSKHEVQVYFSGKPHEAVRPPWDGGWTFVNDEKGRPWMTVTCQEIGASIWYPNKDHQSDEPDNGASLTMRVSKELMAVGNGHLLDTTQHKDGTVSYKWGVENPISNYTIIPYIGHYENFSETYKGLNGKLELDYWVLDYNLKKAKEYMPPEVNNTLKAFEYWFGPYPFYEDGFKIVESEHLGMEHQSNIAYGNRFSGGYKGKDLSNTGIGLTWDFVIVHEAGHEWFGNNVTVNDLADLYIHESFTNYSETLFIDYWYGEEAANDYNYGIRSGIKNDTPIIPSYGVNARGSGDMYPKGGNMLHSIRHSMSDDALFRQILIGINKDYRNGTIAGKVILDYISKQANYNYSKVYEQYLTTIQIPKLQLYIDAPRSRIFYRYVNCVDGFNLPLVLKGDKDKIKIVPSSEWQSVGIQKENQYLLTPWRIEHKYYVDVELVKEMEK